MMRIERTDQPPVIDLTVVSSDEEASELNNLSDSGAPTTGYLSEEFSPEETVVSMENNSNPLLSSPIKVSLSFGHPKNCSEQRSSHVRSVAKKTIRRKRTVEKTIPDEIVRSAEQPEAETGPPPPKKPKEYKRCPKCDRKFVNIELHYKKSPACKPEVQRLREPEIFTRRECRWCGGPGEVMSSRLETKRHYRERHNCLCIECFVKFDTPQDRVNHEKREHGLFYSLDSDEETPTEGIQLNAPVLHSVQASNAESISSPELHFGVQLPTSLQSLVSATAQDHQGIKENAIQFESLDPRPRIAVSRARYKSSNCAFSTIDLSPAIFSSKQVECVTNSDSVGYFVSQPEVQVITVGCVSDFSTVTAVNTAVTETNQVIVDAEEGKAEEFSVVQKPSFALRTITPRRAGTAKQKLVVFTTASVMKHEQVQIDKSLKQLPETSPSFVTCTTSVVAERTKSIVSYSAPVIKQISSCTSREKACSSGLPLLLSSVVNDNKALDRVKKGQRAKKTVLRKSRSSDTQESSFEISEEESKSLDSGSEKAKSFKKTNCGSEFKHPQLAKMPDDCGKITQNFELSPVNSVEKSTKNSSKSGSALVSQTLKSTELSKIAEKMKDTSKSSSMESTEKTKVSQINKNSKGSQLIDSSETMSKVYKPNLDPKMNGSSNTKLSGLTGYITKRARKDSNQLELVKSGSKTSTSENLKEISSKSTDLKLKQKGIIELKQPSFSLEEVLSAKKRLNEDFDLLLTNPLPKPSAPSSPTKNAPKPTTADITSTFSFEPKRRVQHSSKLDVPSGPVRYFFQSTTRQSSPPLPSEKKATDLLFTHFKHKQRNRCANFEDDPVVKEIIRFSKKHQQRTHSKSKQTNSAAFGQKRSQIKQTEAYGNRIKPYTCGSTRVRKVWKVTESHRSYRNYMKNLTAVNRKNVGESWKGSGHSHKRLVGEPVELCVKNIFDLDFDLVATKEILASVPQSGSKKNELPRPIPHNPLPQPRNIPLEPICGPFSPPLPSGAPPALQPPPLPPRCWSGISNSSSANSTDEIRASVASNSDSSFGNTVSAPSLMPLVSSDDDDNHQWVDMEVDETVAAQITAQQSRRPSLNVAEEPPPLKPVYRSDSNNNSVEHIKSWNDCRGSSETYEVPINVSSDEEEETAAPKVPKRSITSTSDSINLTISVSYQTPPRAAPLSYEVQNWPPAKSTRNIQSPQPCGICKESFSCINEHFNLSHSPSPSSEPSEFCSEKCCDVYFSKGDYYKHRKRYHSKQTTHKCFKCQSLFPNNGYLIDHLRYFHGNEAKHFVELASSHQKYLFRSQQTPKLS